MPQPLLVQRAEALRSASTRTHVPWAVVFWVGVGMAIIGYGDIAFLWAPLQLNNPAWRVETIRATIDALPLGTLGLTAIMVASVGLASDRALAFVMVIAGLLFFAIAYAAAVHTLNARNLPQNTGADPTLELARIGLFSAVYLFVYGLIAVAAARRVGNA